jgi:hypothetical protein
MVYPVADHPKVRVFLAHGGLLGTIEAVHVGVPMIGIPMYGDQSTNMKMVAAAGMATILQYKDITKDNVLKALRTVLDSPRCNTDMFLCSHSVILYYSKITTATNTEIKSDNGNKYVNIMKVSHPDILTERTLETSIC